MLTMTHASYHYALTLDFVNNVISDYADHITLDHAENVNIDSADNDTNDCLDYNHSRLC